MGERHRFGDDERTAIGDAAGIPWQRVCPFCGHHPAVVGTGEHAEATDVHGNVVIDDPWLGCRSCGEEWQAAGVRYVLAEAPPLDGPALEAFTQAFVDALKGP